MNSRHAKVSLGLIPLHTWANEVGLKLQDKKKLTTPAKLQKTRQAVNLQKTLPHHHAASWGAGKIFF